MNLPPLPSWSLVQPKLLWLALPALLAAAVVTFVFRLRLSWISSLWGPVVGLAAGLAAGNLAAGVPWQPDIDRAPLLDWWSSTPGWSSLFLVGLASLLGGALAGIVQRRSPLLALILRLATISVCC